MVLILFELMINSKDQMGDKKKSIPLMLEMWGSRSKMVIRAPSAGMKHHDLHEADITPTIFPKLMDPIDLFEGGIRVLGLWITEVCRKRAECIDEHERFCHLSF